MKKQIAELIEQNQMLMKQQAKMQDQSQIIEHSCTANSKQPIVELATAEKTLKLAEYKEICAIKQNLPISMASNNGEALALLKAIVLLKEESAEQRSELAVYRERERAFRRAQTEDLFRQFGI
jgi:hypothetical protein